MLAARDLVATIDGDGGQRQDREPLPLSLRRAREMFVHIRATDAAEIARLRALIATKAAIDKSSLSPVLIARNEALAEAADVAERYLREPRRTALGYRIRALIKP